MADKGSAKKSPPPPTHCRRSYQSRAHKLATLFVMTAGSANATQFPMMFIAYGGAPFLLAYLAFLGVVTFPILRLESNLAQFAGDGNRGIFSTVPLFLGVGYSMTAYAVLHAVADTAPLSDALALLLSWTRSFEWHHDCPGGFMTRNLTCYTIRKGSIPCQEIRRHLSGGFHLDEVTEGLPLAISDEVLLVDVRTYKKAAEACIPDLPDTAPPYDFRRSHTWEQSSYDASRAEPIFVVALIWVLVFAIAHRGILRLKAFFYAIIILHVLTTLMLLARASFLSGSMRGLYMLLHANWTSTANLEMWSHALYVSLESVGVTGTIYLNTERLNCFKNRFQEDVMFVLVADTASKSICTIVSFLFLGHLSDSTGIKMHMLVHADFNFIVSITPQAVSLGSYPEFWSRVHSLWVVSMMLPKFLIMPDIIIEVLSACHPPVLVNRRMTHFFICGFLFFLNMALSSPGGARVFSILSYNQNVQRLIILAVEVIVIVQFYGPKRLAIDSRLMTNEEPGFFVKLCWTSLIPVVVVALLSARLITVQSQDRRYPALLNMLIVWVSALELSFIPVCAVVFMVCTKLSFRECLLPLPTWVPDGWEEAMVYRQQLVAEDTQLQDLASPSPESVQLPPCPASPSQSPDKRWDSPSESSSDMLGTHMILTSEGKNSPNTSDWRYDSSEERDGKPPVKWRSPEKVVPDSGIFHVSRPLSAVWRSVKAKAHHVPVTSASPRAGMPKTAGTHTSHAASPSVEAPCPHSLPFPPSSRDEEQLSASQPLTPGAEAGPVDSLVRADVVFKSVVEEDALHRMDQSPKETASPAISSDHEGLHVEAVSLPQPEEPATPRESPSPPLLPESRTPAEEKASHQGEQQRAPETRSPSELPVYCPARQHGSKKLDDRKGVVESGRGSDASQTPAPFSGRSPLPSQGSARLPSSPKGVNPDQHEIAPFGAQHRAKKLVEKKQRAEGSLASPDSPRIEKKGTVSPKGKRSGGSPKFTPHPDVLEVAGEVVLPDIAPPAPHPLAKQRHRRRSHGHRSPGSKSKRGSPTSLHPEKPVLSPASPAEISYHPQSFAPSTKHDLERTAHENVCSTDKLSPDVVVSPRYYKATDKRTSAASADTLADKKPETPVSPSGKCPSPARKASRRRKVDGASSTVRAAEKKPSFRKKVQAQPSVQGLLAATSQKKNAGNVPASPPAVMSPGLKPKKGKAGDQKATALSDKMPRRSAAASRDVNARSVPSAPSSVRLNREQPLTPPLTAGASPIASETEEIVHLQEEVVHRSPSLVKGGSGTTKFANRSGAIRDGSEPAPQKDSPAMRPLADHSPTARKSPEAPVTLTPTSQSPTGVPHLVSASVAAMDEDAGSQGASQAQDEAEGAKRMGTEHKGDRLVKSESDHGASRSSPGTDNIGSDATGQAEDQAETAKGTDRNGRNDGSPKKKDDREGKRGATRQVGASKTGLTGHHKRSHHRAK